MKKQISSGAVLFILASLLSGAVIEVPSITISDSSQFVDVNISFSSEKSFAGYQITLQYNQQVLKILDVQKGYSVSSFTVMTNTNTPGIVRIAGFNPSLTGISGNGILATLKFQIINPGYSNLIISSVKLSDAGGQTIPCSSLSGSIRASQAGQQREKPSSTPEETKPKDKPVPPPVITQPPPASPPKPQGQKPAEAMQPGIEEFDIDGMLIALEAEDNKEKKEITKEIPQQKSANSVTLTVLSEYGNPFPPVGVSSFSKGDFVDCRVEKEIVLSETEKVVCTGCEGKGSAYNAKGNFLSFKIDRDSRIVWKWKKEPVEPGFLIEVQNEVSFNGRPQVSVPLEIRFLGGFKKPVYISTTSRNFDIILSETWLVPEKRKSTLLIKKDDKLAAGKYPIELVAQSEDRKITSKNEVNVMVHAYVFLGKPIIDENTKTARIPVNLDGIVNDISSFRIELKLDKTIRFVNVEPRSDVRVFSGISQKGTILEIKGGLIPSFKVDKGEIFKIVMKYSREFSPELIRLNSFSLWNDSGEPIPLIINEK